MSIQYETIDRPTADALDQTIVSLDKYLRLNGWDRETETSMVKVLDKLTNFPLPASVSFSRISWDLNIGFELYVWNIKANQWHDYQWNFRQVINSSDKPEFTTACDLLESVRKRLIRCGLVNYTVKTP